MKDCIADHVKTIYYGFLCDCREDFYYTKKKWETECYCEDWAVTFRDGRIKSVIVMNIDVTATILRKSK